MIASADPAKTVGPRDVFKRHDTPICDGTKFRAFVQRDKNDPDRLRAIRVPEDPKVLCQ